MNSKAAIAFLRPLFLAAAAALGALVPLQMPAVDAAKQVPRDLAGTVHSAEGRPISDASVFIYTAGPRVGIGFL